MKASLLAAAASAALLCLAQNATAGDTASNYQIDSAHDGNITFSHGFKAPLKMKWSVDLGGQMSYPVAGNGMVFVTVNLNSGAQLYALDEKTGATMWHKTVANTYFGANATYDNGTVFVLNYDGLLQAFKADSVGTPVWTVQLGNNGEYETPPTAYKGRIYLGSYDGIYSVSETDGSNYTAPYGSGQTSPAVGNGKVFVSLACDEMAFSSKNMKGLWDYSFGCSGGGGANPSYFGGNVYGLDQIHGNLVINAKTGQPVRSFSAAYPPAFWTPAEGNPMGFAATGSAVNAFDTVTGNNGWSFSVSEGVNVPPLAINDVVVVGSRQGTLSVLDAASGSVLWSTVLDGFIGNDNSIQTSGMGVGDGDLLVPYGTKLSSWVPKKKKK
jgi:outer membrane protein assembly factor BamB